MTANDAQADLFGTAGNLANAAGVIASIPVQPGKTDTSAAAARAIEPVAAALRHRCLAALRRAGGKGLTPSECAARLRAIVLSIRPRFTDLKDAGFIRDSGMRRENARGRKEIVWVVAS
ncbi:MAG: hypothetical protein SFV21_12585 [Rhodospirillaceae bacterium]|nr:hypothetical protein [Rhodospirillaceae bacterium]